MSSSQSTSLLPASLSTFIDPPLLGSPIVLTPNQIASSLPSATALAPRIDAAVQDYLFMEALNALRASSVVARERLKKREAEMIKNGLLTASQASGSTPVALPNTPPLRASTLGKGQVISVEDEDLRVRLDAMGVHIGANLAERLILDKPRFTDALDTVKFLCKDVWLALWEKQIDNLRTNHRGVYVLQDNTFRPITRISSAEGPSDALKKAKIYTALSSGVLRGALLRLGVQATVTAEITALPQCTFQVKLPKSA